MPQETDNLKPSGQETAPVLISLKWGESMFKLIHKNRKGVTLVELLVSVAVLGLVIPLVGGIFYNVLKFNNAIIDKWDVQTAVKLACSDFENNKDGLTSAFQVDLLYDPIIEEGVTLDKSTGNIEWRSGSAACKVMNAEGIPISADEHKNDVFTYIFSAKTWDTEGVYLGELLYMRGYGDNRSHLLLQDYGMGEIPVSVTFSVGTTKDMVVENVDPFYTLNTITMHFRSGKEEVKFGYETSFAIVNINTDTRPINYSGGKLVCDLRWLDSDVKTPLVHVAGWDSYDLNYDEEDNLTTANGFPVASTTAEGEPCYETSYVNANDDRIIITDTFSMEYVDENGITKTVNAPVLAREGNVLRYKSPTAEKTQVQTIDQSAPTNVASCLTGFAMMGSGMRDQVLGNLRMFRDNVLRGTEFGDWFIHQYYYEWSPFLIEKTAWLKPVYQAVLIPISQVCGFIAKL